MSVIKIVYRHFSQVNCNMQVNWCFESKYVYLKVIAFLSFSNALGYVVLPDISLFYHSLSPIMRVIAKTYCTFNNACDKIVKFCYVGKWRHDQSHSRYWFRVYRQQMHNCNYLQGPTKSFGELEQAFTTIFE